MSKSVLILSGGLDSTVSAFVARDQTELASAIFFDYGQRAAMPEQKAARSISRRLGLDLQLMALPWLGQQGHSALTDESRELPTPQTNELDDLSAAQNSADAVWVPNRNGLFLNIAAALAESLGADQIVTGFNAEEAATFPDNSADFVQAANRFFSFSTQNNVRVKSYTQEWNKEQIVREGLERDIPFQELWSCYRAETLMCGECESCKRSVRAYQAVGIWEQMKGRFTK